jgi:acyl-CoA reductase-like NAD-dependent aldehyde dehydrogenase
VRWCTLELGGKGAAVLLDDIGLETVIAGLTAPMAFINGQACNAPTRILVPRSRYSEIVAGFADAFPALPFGDPMDPATFVGPSPRSVRTTGSADTSRSVPPRSRGR